ncbi:MAG: heavy-metal-associated domain-containing protein [Thermoleophilia bacterium]|nr:heavy-metal-associated domain-containing protein [Thermoleophilia bacterium]
METSRKVYAVEGMTCSHCELSVREEVEQIAGVEAATASHDSGRLVVRGSGFDDESIRAAVEEAGYRLVGPAEAGR